MPLALFPSFPAPSHCLLFLLSFSHFCPLYCVCFCFFSIRSTRRLLLCLPLPFEFASVALPSPLLFSTLNQLPLRTRSNAKRERVVEVVGKEGPKTACEMFMEHLGVRWVQRSIGSTIAPSAVSIGIVIGPT